MTQLVPFPLFPAPNLSEVTSTNPRLSAVLNTFFQSMQIAGGQISKALNNLVVSSATTTPGTGTIQGLVASNTNGVLVLRGLRAGTGIILTQNSDGTVTIST